MTIFCFLPGLCPHAKILKFKTHIAAHLQTHTTLRPYQRFAKELQFCLHTRTNKLHLSFEKFEQKIL